MWLEIAFGVAAGFLLVWLALIAALYLIGRRLDDRTTFTEVLRMLPDVLRLLRRLATDRTLPRTVRIRLGLLIGYLLFPLDLVPDVIPVVGYADDAVIVAIALRSVTRAAGPEALDRHWPGTPDGLRALKRIAGVA
jgi:uncharacterized membrane protein YkvA (DUF1232 family)